MRKNALLSLAMLGAAAVVVSGCTSGSPNEGGTGGNEPGGETPQVTISYTNFISNGGNEQNLQTIIDAFEAENAGIKVEVTTLPYGDYGTALQTDLAAGTVSDVFDIEYANYVQYQANGVLAPLSISNAGDYRPAVLEAYATGGTQYALPSSFSTVVLFYNSDLFEAAGVDAPAEDWTWAEVEAAAEALTNEAAGVWGVHQPVSFHEYYKVLEQNGASFLDETGTAAAFNTPAGIEAAEWLVGKSGTVMPTIEQGQGTPDFDTNLFNEGELAMLYTGIWMFGAFADAPFDWDIAVEPGNTQQASALFSNAVGVSASSDHVEAATRFAQFLTSSEIMVDTRLEAGWELPAISDEARLATYLTLDTPANRQAVFDSLDQVALPPVVERGQQEMQDIITEELIEAQAGRKSVADALASAEQRINAVIG